MVSVIFR